MNKILKIRVLLVSITLLVFGSCSIDDDPATVIPETTSIEVSLDSLITIPSGTTSYDLPVMVSQAFTQAAKIDYSVNEVDFSEIFTGSENAVLPITISNDSTQVQITDFSLLDSNLEGVTPSVSSTSNSAIIVLE